MKKNTDVISIALLVLVFICFVIVSAVSLHSVEEIHYLKSFFPDQFSVEEAKDATIIEFFKVGFVMLPVMLFTLFCLLVMTYRKSL